MGDGYTTPCHPGPPAYPHCPVPLPGLWREGNRGSTKRKFLYASIIYADKAYNAYEIEDLLKEVDHIHLLPMRKKNSTRALSPSVTFVQSYYRKRVETAGSQIEQLLPKSIHAVTSQGFELKVALFVIASSLNSYANL